MTFFSIDWKFTSGFLVSVLAIVISLYLPRAELTAHALTMSLVSSSALQPPTGARFQDLQVTLNGNKIENPYVSSLTITNTGSKPISSSDFETPIVLTTEEPASLVTARVTGSAPKGIPIDLRIEGGKIQILPFLSNPNDEITFALVTSGKPSLQPTARIAGVSELLFEDLTRPRPRPLAAFLACLIAATCFFLYTFYLSRGRLFKPMEITPLIRLPTIFCLAICGIQAAQLIATQLISMATVGIAAVIITIITGAGLGLIAVRIANRSDLGSS